MERWNNENGRDREEKTKKGERIKNATEETLQKERSGKRRNQIQGFKEKERRRSSESSLTREPFGYHTTHHHPGCVSRKLNTPTKRHGPTGNTENMGTNNGA